MGIATVLDGDLISFLLITIFSIVSGVIARNKNLTFKDKNHSFIGYFLLGFLTNPIVSIILAASLKNNRNIEKVTVENPVQIKDEKPAQVNKSESTDITEKIKKLSELKDQGILTEEEFQNKKKDLLDKI